MQFDEQRNDQRQVEYIEARLAGPIDKEDAKMLRERLKQLLKGASKWVGQRATAVRTTPEPIRETSARVQPPIRRAPSAKDVAQQMADAASEAVKKDG